MHVFQFAPQRQHRGGHCAKGVVELATGQQNGRDLGMNLRLPLLLAKPLQDRQTFLCVDAKCLVQPTRDEVDVRNAV